MKSLDSDTLDIRPAVAAESDLIADIVFGDPEQETTRVAMCLYGLKDADRARRVFRLLWRSGENWRQTELAVRNGSPVAILQLGRSGFQIRPLLVLRLTGIVGPVDLLRMARRMRLKDRVSPRMPSSALVISELHVDSRARGQGIGAALLERAVRQAKERGAPALALQTLTTNPARRLYERSGFVVQATVKDDDFLRLTGAEGNVLMVKQLDQDSP